MGNGQYYDPQTGRFLTRDAQPGSLNPYVPGNADPTGLLIGPMALLVLVRGRKEKKGSGKLGFLLLVMVVLIVGSLTLTACSGDGEVIPPGLPPTVIGSVTPITTPSTTPTQTKSPTVTPTQTATCTSTSTPYVKKAYLTFDDQPNALTPTVLSKLQDYGNIKATFFVIGKHIEDMGYLPLITADGHTIGLHSMNHTYPWYRDPDYMPYETVEERMKAQLSDLMNLVTPHTKGIQPVLWRAPGGFDNWEDSLPEPYNKTLYRYAWDINPQDILGNNVDAQTIFDTYTNEMARIEGSSTSDSIIVLMHGWTPDALDKIIPDLKNRGYEFGVLPRPGDPIGPIIGSQGGK